MLKKIKLPSFSRRPALIGSSDDMSGNRSRRWLRLFALFLVAYLLVVLVLSIIWSNEPEQFDIREAVASHVENSERSGITGVASSATLIHVAQTLLEKPGGYLTNDIFLPGVWLDNMPNWEYGALIQVRDLAKAMREAHSRSQSQSAENAYLASAEPLFNFDNDSWLLPASESEYQSAINYLDKYLQDLVAIERQNAQFFSRADNLRYWLQTVESRLGDVSQRLSASVEQTRFNIDLAGDAAAQQSTKVPEEMRVKTPWHEIDDNFYFARGASWALIHFLKAAEIDFADVLEKKNAKVSLQQIIRELEGTQQTIYSPIILNGSGFGMLTNHSLVMASYVARANAAIIDLRELLAKG